MTGTRLQNGIEMTASNEDKYTTMLALAEGSPSERELAAWLRQSMEPEYGHRVQEPRARYARR